jgi:PTH1 family peptidyl-tRNA hydrolase
LNKLCTAAVVLIEGKVMASDCWLIVGLGNPGKEYEGTRHNMGFMCADVLAQRWTISMSDHKGLAKLGKGILRLDGKQIRFFLAKPLTFMNESGNAVASIAAYYDIDPHQIVVIHDDMDLEYGRIKVKSGGSAGGHNGIKSIDKSLGSNAYGRVRLGVGHAARQGDAHRNTVNWVLGGFSRDQKAQLPDFLADGADAAETLITHGLAAAQENFNGR